VACGAAFGALAGDRLLLVVATAFRADARGRHTWAVSG
jgi:hypothetical protein